VAALTAPPGTALQIAQLLATGAIDTREAGRLAKAGNLSMLDVAHALTTLREAAEPQEPDLRSPEERQLDAAFPVARPEDYRINYADSGQDPPLMAPELKQFDQSARTWLGAAGFQKDTCNSLVTTIAKVTQQTQHMTPDQLEHYGYAEFAKLQKAHGPALEERLHSAALMIYDLDLKQPGLKNLLKSRGIGDNAMVANMLITHAQICHARKGHKATRGERGCSHTRFTRRHAGCERITGGVLGAVQS
jgi:hypothetical protein